MKKGEIVWVFWTVIFALVLLQSSGAVWADPADKLPPANFTLPAPDSAQAQNYLGIEATEPFTVCDIKASLVVIEFMSALCPVCHTNAPIVNNLYKAIQADSRLADVKVVAIATGSKKAAVEAYKKKFKVPFPVLLDENLAISASMKGVPTPTTMIVSTENGKVLFSHSGVIEDPDQFLKRLRALHKKNI